MENENALEQQIELKVGSPSNEKRVLDLELKLKEERYENEYSTCCCGGVIDKRLIHYGSKFSLSLIIIGFAFYQLINADECDALVPWYTSIVTMVISVWVKPSTNVAQKGK